MTFVIIVCIIIIVEIEFDPKKDASNFAKHGVNLSLAQELNWDMLLAVKDFRNDYGEIRWIGYAPIRDRVYCVVFTERSRVYRIISLRKANKREVKSYASQI